MATTDIAIGLTPVKIADAGDEFDAQFSVAVRYAEDTTTPTNTIGKLIPRGSTGTLLTSSMTRGGNVYVWCEPPNNAGVASVTKA